MSIVDYGPFAIMRLDGNMHPNVAHVSSQTCPFCDYTAPAGDANATAYNLAHHVEIKHRENGTGISPFEVTQSSAPSDDAPQHTTATRSKRHLGPVPSSSSLRSTAGNVSYDSEAEYLECPRDCGELISKEMLDQHIGLHQAEELALDELEGQYETVGAKARGRYAKFETYSADAHDDAHKSPKLHGRALFKDLFGLTSPIDAVQRKTGVSKSSQRLGRKELGPHAYEDKMPSWLFKQLKEGPPRTGINQIGADGRIRRVEKVANETPGLVPALADLCRQDRAVSKAWFCSPGARHIFKMRREGGFCGYRNIQMQVSWMQYHQHPGFEHFGVDTPNILDLQATIEDAWKSGINSSGKAETGGIIGTRKYIGTPEAQALFQYLGIECQAQAFTKNRPPDRTDPVYAILLEYVLQYFAAGVTDPTDKVYMTDLAPIYFQHPGHSLTIVGIEVLKNRDINLLVFDPMFPTVPSMIRYLGSGSTSANPGKILKAFRRGDDYLKKYKSFEVLSLKLPRRSPQARSRP